MVLEIITLLVSVEPQRVSNPKIPKHYTTWPTSVQNLSLLYKILSRVQDSLDSQAI